MAEIAVGLAITKAALLVDNLANKLYASISGDFSLLSEEFQFIKDELEMMSAFLREAEEKQAGNEAARAWVKQVREVAYAVEDCIDEFSLYLEQQGSCHSSMAGALWNRARLLAPSGAHRRIAAQIRSIKSRVEVLSNRRLRYGITDVSNASGGDEDNVVRYDPRLAALFVEDSLLVGIDGPRKKLVGWLLDENESQLRLIAVVGEGGLGKTTIVKKAYESSKVIDGRFTCRAWITVSQEYHIEGLLRDMIRQVLPSPPDDLDMTGRTGLIAKLSKHLKEKRYMIVFDDIWKIDTWNNLALALPKNDLGSRVMLTTRNVEVAETCCSQFPGYIYQHKKLSIEESMDLFCKRVFNNLDHTCPKALRKLSQDILEKCGGLPLAILSIAGILASKPMKTIQEWENMLDRLGSELAFNPNLMEMKQILTFSYNDLPYYVKRCFLYLSKFPEDYLITRKRIQRLWIAEGFVAGRRDMTPEEVAESYFNELVNRFMVLPIVFSASGKVKSFRVHDIMLELIVSKSTEDNFVTLLGKNSTWTPQDVIRRLSVHSEHNLQNISHLSHVRSLSMLRHGSLMLISPSLRLLRVLDLDGCDALRNLHLEIVVKLLHLRYLSLRNVHKVSKLPKLLGNLRNLETLDVRGTTIEEIPSTIVNLRCMRFLRGDCFREIKFPKGFGSLRSLQKLANVSVTSSGKDVVKELGKLTQLRSLAVSNIPKKSEEEFCNSVKVLGRSLRSLTVRSRSLDFLDDLTYTFPRILSLKLHGTLGMLPSWVCSLDIVAKIVLTDSRLENEGIRALGTLPNLTQLHLLSACKEKNLCFDSEGFPRLKLLYLKNLDIAILSFGEGTMCHLESFFLLDERDKKAPRRSISGIKNLPTLKEITFRGMHREDLDAVHTQVNGHPNHTRLTASHIFHVDDTGLRQWD